MRIGIMGASGRVGTSLVETIIASPGLELAAALVSASSRLNGSPVAGGGIEYRPADAAINSHCDVIIDFSRPDASLALQESIGGKAIPMVIGTTGFTADEEARLRGYSKYRPMLVSANFAQGFEAFRLAVLGFARQMPAAEPTVMETYHIRKKSDPSGTSRLLADQLCQARSTVMGFAAQKPTISVRREGETVGINAVCFAMGSAELVMTYQVHTLAAYAEGAIGAAHWLISKPRAPGSYSLADSLDDND